MFKEQDGKGKTPYDLGLEAGNLGKDNCPYEEESEAYIEFYDGYYDAEGIDDEEDSDW